MPWDRCTCCRTNACSKAKDTNCNTKLYKLQVYSSFKYTLYDKNHFWKFFYMQRSIICSAIETHKKREVLETNGLRIRNQHPRISQDHLVVYKKCLMSCNQSTIRLTKSNLLSFSLQPLEGQGCYNFGTTFATTLNIHFRRV